MYILDLQLDCLSYNQMGPAERVIRSKDGEKMYVVITYKRGGKFYELKVPKFFSAYFERPYIFIRHSYGMYYIIERLFLNLLPKLYFEF